MSRRKWSLAKWLLVPLVLVAFIFIGLGRLPSVMRKIGWVLAEPWRYWMRWVWFALRLAITCPCFYLAIIIAMPAIVVAGTRGADAVLSSIGGPFFAQIERGP